MYDEFIYCFLIVNGVLRKGNVALRKVDARYW